MVVRTYVKRKKEKAGIPVLYKVRLSQEIITEARIHLCKEREIPYVASVLTDAEKVAELMFNLFEMEYLADEYVYMLGFDAGCRLLGIVEISHGCACESICRPRELFQAALLMNAEGIIMVRNHPSGNCKISKGDRKNMKEIVSAGELLRIKVLDYIILGQNEFYSAAQQNDIR